VRPLLISQQGSHVQISLPSGRKLSNQNADFRAKASLDFWLYDYFRKVCTGISATNPNYENSDTVGQFNFEGHDSTHPNRPDVSDSDLAGASIQGTYTFHVERFEVLKVTPFKAGAGIDLTRQHYYILKIVPSDGSIRFLLNRSVVPLLLRGDLERWSYGNEQSLPFVIMNRRTGEILNDQNVSDYFNPLDGLHLQWWTLTKKLSRGAPQNQPPPPIPADWLNDADICFFDFQSLGSITFPYSAKVTKIIH
jgi:hypothetical protein